ncbi:aldose epimerase family protein [Citreimonas sp.]|uniref:aldose epimerase family protein n=1 Tax=Citreimonas sp. TaxID=3036715 RepID=UPI004057F6E5
MTRTILAHAPDGAPIEQVTLDNGVLQARILSFGGTLRDLRLAGLDRPLVLGFERVEDYTENPLYLGVSVGRLANRVVGGDTIVDGRPVQLDRNEGGRHMLHGGQDGTGRRSWRIEDHGPGHALLSDTLPDGHMGFPGTLNVQLRYELDAAALRVTYTATADAPTICSFAPHLYFNLSGGDTIDDHVLTVHADRYMPGEGGVPTGELASVEGTPFDLRQGGSVPAGADHNLCIAEAAGPLREIARLDASDLGMRILSTEPGLQLFDGGALAIPAGAGLDGRAYGARAGMALEPQRWPDAPNNAWRDQVTLAPGQTFRAESCFVFEPGVTAPA